MKLVLHYLALVFSASAAVANHFIVEFETTHNARSFRRSLDSLSSSLKRRTLKHEITRTFATDGIFHGVAVKLNDATDAKAIAKMSGVKTIRPSMHYNAPNPVHMQIARDLNDASIPLDTGSTHTMIGVDKVHAKGNFGKGVNIGIIDTGVDYTHPSLGGGFGQGFKVNGGYDFVGDAFDPSNEGAQPVPDSDPLDTCNGHGTVVAGIIGADSGNKFNITGVAPGAFLSAYRVFGCTGSTRDDIIIAALLQAVKDKQDIITLSLGQPSGWTDSTVGVVVDRIAASGIIITAAVGNNGASGSWSAASPSTGIHAISVASVDNTVLPARNAVVKGVDHEPIQYVSLFPLNTTSTLPIYATSKDTSVEDDACKPLPDDTPDLSTFLVVIRRGNCSYVQKIKNVANKGAKFAFIYNNANGPLSLSIPSSFSVGGIEGAHGEFLVQQFAAKASISLSFPQDSATSLNDPHGKLMSVFSSIGPTFNLFFKPAVSAPGGNIISIFPVVLGSYVIVSGTSMATPYVAGSAALLVAALGRTEAVGKGALSLLESTAQKLPSTTNDSDPLQTLIQQGAGLINVSAAIESTTIISPTELLLNSTAHFNSVQTFTVKNTGTKAKSYTLKHVPAGTAITVKQGSIFVADGPVPLSSNYASVEMTPSSNFNVKPGKTQKVKVKFTQPTGLDPGTFPVFSGFIEVNSGPESHHVVYLGAVGDLKDKKVLDTTSDFTGFQLPAIATPDSKIQSQFTNYTFGGIDYPLLLFRMSFGSALINIDLVDASHSSITGDSFSDDMVVGSILSKTSIPRNNDDLSSEGLVINKVNMQTAVFDDGSKIPNGSYRFLIRALRVTGNPNIDEDYDYALSDSFGIQV